MKRPWLELGSCGRKTKKKVGTAAFAVAVSVLAKVRPEIRFTNLIFLTTVLIKIQI
jgi:hypothetical protein